MQPAECGPQGNRELQESSDFPWGRYELHQSLEDGRVLVFIESWKSDEKWRAHMQGGAIKRFHASAAGNLIQDFSLIRMNLVADGGPH